MGCLTWLANHPVLSLPRLDLLGMVSPLLQALPERVSVLSDANVGKDAVGLLEKVTAEFVVLKLR